MSHEGIRIVSESEVRREAQAEHKLSPEAVTPARVKVKKTEGTGMEIEWRDGHTSSWNFRWLRDACPAPPATRRGTKPAALPESRNPGSNPCSKCMRSLRVRWR